jgi:peptidoglycan/xylan/chitin deacetylase (PgdA/CDA1 family)
VIFGKNSLKALYFVLLKLAQQDKRLLRQIKQSDHLVILNLHQISPHNNPFWPPLSPDIFEDLLIFLKRHFQVLLFENLDAAANDKPKAVLSFDDGYYNFMEYAMPLLAKHGMAANLNVIPACVESGLPPWNVQLYDFLNAAPRSLINELRLPGFNYLLESDGFDRKVQYGLKISSFMKNRPRREREELWREIVPVMAKAKFKSTRMMSVTEIKQASMHEIGAHSFSHESMAYEDEQFFCNDVEACIAYFQNVLNLPLTIYAFPNGSYRPKQINVLHQKGIKHVLLVDEKYATCAAPVYPRFTIYGLTRLEARFQALGYNNKA